MKIQAPRDRRTQQAVRDRPLVQGMHPHVVLRRVIRHLRSREVANLPSEDQQHLVLTSFVLGCLSLFTAFFPICGFPIAVTGLLLGLYGRRTMLRPMATWAAALSTIGLLLTCINVIVIVGMYFAQYMWQ